MKTNSAIQWLLLLSLLYGVAWAEPADLYAAEVAVADDSVAVRTEALSQALQQVLVKVSGSTEVGGHPGAAAVLARPGSLVQQYRYRLDSAGESPQRYLWAKFDKVALDRLLRESGIPLWGSRRPRLLVWLAVEQGGRRSLLNLEGDMTAREAMQQRAAARGLPLQLPLMDLQDQAALNAADLWADYEAALREASRRYPHDVILTGRLRASDGHWQSDWTLWEADRQQTFDTAALPWPVVLQAGIDGAQNRLAARYVPATQGDDGPEPLRVSFSGIDSLAAYGRLMQILGQHESISRIKLRQVEGDRVLTELWVRGGRGALSRGLSLGGELQSQPVPEVPVADTEQVGVPEPVDLHFSYLRGDG